MIKSYYLIWHLNMAILSQISFFLNNESKEEEEPKEFLGAISLSFVLSFIFPRSNGNVECVPYTGKQFTVKQRDNFPL